MKIVEYTREVFYSSIANSAPTDYRITITDETGNLDEKSVIQLCTAIQNGFCDLALEEEFPESENWRVEKNVEGSVVTLEISRRTDPRSFRRLNRIIKALKEIF